MNHASVAHKITVQRKKTQQTKHEFHTKTQLNEYLLQINVTFAVAYLALCRTPETDSTNPWGFDRTQVKNHYISVHLWLLVLAPCYF